MAYKPIDPNSVGVGRKYDSVQQQADTNNGSYNDQVANKPLESLLPLKEFPKAPDPKPYK